MINLKDTTFIIPVCVESHDRYRNAVSVLGYLNHHFNTNVIIHELFEGNSNLDFLGQFDNLNLKVILEKSNLESYHRTRQLNEMLSLVQTPFVSNYDIDVVLPVDSYVKSVEMLKNDSDVVYPYGDGQFQKRVPENFNRINFDQIFQIKQLDDFGLWDAKCGHCFFIKTDLYKKCGGENENFIAYGPEDVERYGRFHKFGYKVDRINDFIYHFEHSRTPFSDKTNSFFEANHSLWEDIKRFDKESFENYYRYAEYRSKYSW